jgi:type I restriction enzyme S subunit
MCEQRKKALLPKLRFPEFREAGEWEKTKLGGIGKFTGGGTPNKENNGYWEGKNPWISSSDISEDSIHDIKISRFITDEAIQETATKLVPANSILLVSRVSVGKLAVTKKPICTSQDFTSFTPTKDDLVFVAYYLKSLKNAFLSLNQGMAIKGFTKEDVSSLEICLPKLIEQQKIADCLASLDDLITAQTQKLDTLKTHKKGLLQQLFPSLDEVQARVH